MYIYIYRSIHIYMCMNMIPVQGIGGSKRTHYIVREHILYIFICV